MRPTLGYARRPRMHAMPPSAARAPSRASSSFLNSVRYPHGSRAFHTASTCGNFTEGAPPERILSYHPASSGSPMSTTAVQYVSTLSIYPRVWGVTDLQGNQTRFQYGPDFPGADESYFIPIAPTPANRRFGAVYAMRRTRVQIVRVLPFGAYPSVSPSASDVRSVARGGGSHVTSPRQIGGPVSRIVSLLHLFFVWAYTAICE